MKNTKKHFAALAAAAAFTSGTVLTAAAAGETAADMARLQKALAGSENISAAQDVNSDGNVNIFDLCMMKSGSNTETGESKDMTLPITSEYVKFTGRHLLKGETEWLVQSGSAVEFIVTGTKASVSVNGDSHIETDPDHRPRYAVYVDDELVADKTIDEAQEEITAFEGSTSRTARVKVMLLSESNNGGIGVSAIKVTSGSASPVKPAPQKKMLIEFIGDSITCAYGVEGKQSSDPFKTTTENFSKSYAYLAAKQLDADYSAVSYSGHGIVSGYSSGDKESGMLVPPVYTYTAKNEGASAQWDFSERCPDAVFINLGTNDINYVSAEYETRSVEFTEEYLSFLKLIREKNPTSVIICTVGVMGGGNDIYPLIEKAVSLYTEETGDTNITSFESAVHNISADGVGSDWHPSEKTQKSNSYIVADKICKALGIESPGTGLDAASDASYEVVCDPDSGAYAASFLGYDKSFWINMTEGGKNPSDVEAVISGMELKAGGEYKLEFDCSATPAADIPVSVTGKSEYLSEVISEVGNKAHFEKTFTVPEKDDTAKIVLSLGGLSYYNVTISNLKLVKMN